MKSNVPAAKRPKTDANTPFEKISALEQEEKSRVEKEVTAMQSEEEEVRSAVKKKQEEAEKNLRKKAKQELEISSKENLKSILAKKEQETDSALKKLEVTYEGQKTDTVDMLVQTIISSS